MLVTAVPSLACGDCVETAPSASPPSARLFQLFRGHRDGLFVRAGDGLTAASVFPPPEVLFFKHVFLQGIIIASNIQFLTIFLSSPACIENKTHVKILDLFSQRVQFKALKIEKECIRIPLPSYFVNNYLRPASQVFQNSGCPGTADPWQARSPSWGKDQL